MIRKLLAAAITAAALITIAPAPAQAARVPAVGDGGLWRMNVAKYHFSSAHAPRGLPIAPCVTSTWQSKRWHMPKTRVGRTCLAVAGTWIPPHGYRFVGWYTKDGSGIETEVWDALVYTRVS